MAKFISAEASAGQFGRWVCGVRLCAVDRQNSLYWLDTLQVVRRPIEGGYRGGRDRC